MKVKSIKTLKRFNVVEQWKMKVSEIFLLRKFGL